MLGFLIELIVLGLLLFFGMHWLLPKVEFTWLQVVGALCILMAIRMWVVFTHAGLLIGINKTSE